MNRTRLDFLSRYALPLFLIAAAALRQIVVRAHVNVDGTIYLEMAEAFRRGDWSAPINASWSPLYSALLAGVLAITGAGLENETVVARGFNVIVFSAAVYAWHQLLEQVPAARDWLGRTFGWAIFAWAMFCLDVLSPITPDALSAVFLIALFIFLLRITRGVVSARNFALLGAAGGIAYIAKAVMFPITVFSILLAVALARGGRRHVVWAVLAFACTGGLLIGALSIEKQRFTFSDTPHHAYLWDVARMPHLFDADPARDRPLHPPQRLARDPGIWTYPAAPNVSHPLYYDPAYWYEGFDRRFQLRDQLIVAARNAAHTVRVIWPIVLTALLLLVAAASTRTRMDWRLLSLALVPLVGIVIYFPFHLEPRYIAPFVPLLPLAILNALSPARVPRYGTIVIGFCALLLLGQVGYRITRDAAELAGVYPQMRDANRPELIARALTQTGLRPGDLIATTQLPGYWARLARARIRFDVDHGELLRASAGRRACAYQQLAAAGATMLVGVNVPDEAVRDGWIAVTTTEFFVLPLHRFRAATCAP